jgi:NAD(P)-dependent dehydrogenase (short-subunit alcohol dehydrogenase family)
MELSNIFNLSSKTAIITGGGGILGEGFCKILSQYGANVAVLDQDLDAAERVAEKIRSEISDSHILALQCNVSVPASVTSSVEKVVRHFGGIDILHNNAATKTSSVADFFKPFEEYSLETWREVMSVNLDGMFLMAQAVGKQMIVQGRGGSIIQTSSVYGVIAPDQRIYEGSHYLGFQINTPAVYSSSKAAVIGLTKYLSSYWGEYGIRVNTITPGGVESGQNDIFSKNYGYRVPLGRMAALGEMNAALLFLASDASSYVTGHNLVVDGGLSVW